MCGIAGIFLSKKTDANHHQYRKQLEKILANQNYRGPDYQAIEIIEANDCTLLLGHNRLGIIDLESRSNQPMWDETRRFCIVYNGMLYNYVELRKKLMAKGVQLFSEGDTEVVLKSFIAWGFDALNLFNGMFAMAIYDTFEQKVFLIRDRFGVKPLYYYIAHDKLYFASSSSEIARLFELQPNWQTLKRGLQSWCYEMNSETVYEDLTMVSPGELLIIDNQNGLRMTSRCYYNLAERIPLLVQEMNPNPEDLFIKVESLIKDAINIRLRSDVKMGISLSGGVDSGTLASMAKEIHSGLSAYSFGSLHNKASEASMTALTAKKIGLDVHYIYPSQIEMTEGFFDALTVQDAPFPNLSIVAQYFVFKEAHEHGVKVMLGGQGGDEIFMGYRKYLLFYLQQLLGAKKYLAVGSLIFNSVLNIFFEMKNLKTHLFNIKRYTNASENPRWQFTQNPLTLRLNSIDPLWKRQHQDICALSLPTLLRYEDRNSMGNSIESRLPFLDYRLVELALALPENLKINKGFGKWVLREIAAQHIPKKIAYGRLKRGFDVHHNVWIHQGLGERLRNCLKENQPLLRHFKLVNQVDHLFSDQQLILKPSVLAECITLAWLAQKPHFGWS